MPLSHNKSHNGNLKNGVSRSIVHAICSEALSLNVEKTKYSLFHRPSRRDDLPLLLPKLLIKKHKVERVESIKFLGVLLDENLSWKDHIKYIENKVAKNIGLLYRPKLFLEKTR